MSQSDYLTEEDRREEETKSKKTSEIKGSSRKNEKKVDNPDDVGTLFGFLWFNLKNLFIYRFKYPLINFSFYFYDTNHNTSTLSNTNHENIKEKEGRGECRRTNINTLK